MQHLWVILHTGHPALGTFKCGNRSTLGGGSHLEALRCLRNGIPVAHPHLVLCGQSRVQIAARDLHLGAAVFAAASLRHGATQSVGHGLETIADSENGNAQLQQAFLQCGRTIGIDRRRPTGEDQRGRILRCHLFGGHRVRDHLGVQIRLAHSACNELGVLRTEIYNKDRARGLNVVCLSHR